MNSFHSLRDFSLSPFSGSPSSGSPSPGQKGFLHHLHPGLKIMSLLVLGSLIFFLSSPLPLVLFGVVLVLGSFSSGVKFFSLLKGCFPILPFMVFTTLIQIFFIHRGHDSPPLFILWHCRIYREELLFTALLFIRFFYLFSLLSLFNAVSPISEISYGTEGLLKPFFGKSAFPHEAALLVVLVFRFIPILLMEAEYLKKAQAARGGGFRKGRGRVVQKISMALALVIPLFIGALEHGVILAEAMEARGYVPGRKRSSLEEYFWKGRDGLFLVFLLCFSLLLWGFQFAGDLL